MKNQQDYSQAYQAAWNFHKQYFERVKETPNDEKLWSEITQQADTICKQFDNDKFIRKLLLNEIQEFECLRFEVMGKERCVC